jgi:hypothetical protein
MVARVTDRLPFVGSESEVNASGVVVALAVTEVPAVELT